MADDCFRKTRTCIALFRAVATLRTRALENIGIFHFVLCLRDGVLPNVDTEFFCRKQKDKLNNLTPFFIILFFCSFFFGTGVLGKTSIFLLDLDKEIIERII